MTSRDQLKSEIRHLKTLNDQIQAQHRQERAQTARPITSSRSRSRDDAGDDPFRRFIPSSLTQCLHPKPPMTPAQATPPGTPFTQGHPSPGISMFRSGMQGRSSDELVRIHTATTRKNLSRPNTGESGLGTRPPSRAASPGFSIQTGFFDRFSQIN